MSPRRPAAPSVPPSAPTASSGQGGTPGGAAAARPKASTPGARPSTSRGSRPDGRTAASSRPRPGSAGRSSAPRAGLSIGTGRPLWVIGAVGVVLAALILPYFQKWLVQRSQIEAARASVSQSQAQVRTLSEQLAQWQDDQYVKAQARDRLHYVMPGETGYVVLTPKPKRGTTTPGEDAAKVPAVNQPWFKDIWVSAQVAGASAR